LTQVEQRELVKRLLVQAGLEDLVEQLDRRVVELPLGVQRHLAILRVAASGPKLLCMDEPTTDVDEENTRRILEYIKKESARRAMLVILHNQQQAKMLGGHTLLLAGGWVQEMQTTESFFSAPISDPGKDYVRSGNCTVPSPNAKRTEISSQHKAAIKPLPRAARQFKSHVLGPRGFLWLKKGQLAGTPRPGLLKDLDYDLEALKRVGVTHLVSLTEREVDISECNRFGIEVIRSPMPDMHAPSNEQALEICKQITALLETSKVVAVHCRAGLGRTGTILAAQLIYEGNNAINALEKTRSIEPRWVQSEKQVQFLEEFESFIRGIVKDLNGNRSTDVNSIANL
jgi:atypical dual specificity phosphatase